MRTKAAAVVKCKDCGHPVSEHSRQECSHYHYGYCPCKHARV